MLQKGTAHGRQLTSAGGGQGTTSLQEHLSGMPNVSNLSAFRAYFWLQWTSFSGAFLASYGTAFCPSGPKGLKPGFTTS